MNNEGVVFTVLARLKELGKTIGKVENMMHGLPMSREVNIYISKQITESSTNFAVGFDISRLRNKSMRARVSLPIFTRTSYY
jgi:hypothetical protein